MLYEIADLGHLWVVFSIATSERNWFKVGQHIEFWNNEVPKQQYIGRISYIAPIVDTVNTLREVLLGKMIGTPYEILEGLQAGEEVVTDGAFTIDATAQLAGEKSMMNR